MKASPVVCVCCVTLLALPLVSVALTARTAQRNRLSFPRKLWQVEVEGRIAMETVSRSSVTVSGLVRERLLVWKGLLNKEPLLRHSYTLSTPTSSPRPRRRGRRHTLRGTWGHGQLMRVGCVLGTCQVQNLSHRLYQLIGQPGKEDTSPINPRSPHSYG
ncbi:protein ADM2 [Electrophorus electricus]|uniref:protein ADM2 n=1 Tax=Electrophorus electricus TaxID=8005 RepID=UPI0015D06A9C|nr:protein ADM2 [Electrophorus electricus]XP_035381470.1 protein ADM2 [Electrophorus electricus]